MDFKKNNSNYTNFAVINCSVSNLISNLLEVALQHVTTFIDMYILFFRYAGLGDERRMCICENEATLGKTEARNPTRNAIPDADRHPERDFKHTELRPAELSVRLDTVCRAELTLPCGALPNSGHLGGNSG